MQNVTMQPKNYMLSFTARTDLGYIVQEINFTITLYDALGASTEISVFFIF